ncbi:MULTISPECIES: fructosamine kinase family protein [unclassified Halomonas]|uniref:fructosamine kinase family protein n=1 Tax=unclassified Halomonas TaxID=2609666 RepID=UPI002887BD38|nr:MULTISPECIES: fructosamine kinase family protein [unclassified Halomonas]MDT0501595.1 fructosamine kinase family protein [Halomonas sp. PAR7]MDT0511048.1 fructosamine kinase family protein [Halomonas sp. LES1]MDT0592435.1 fructosamine kinase family protein [Halomonas sp. PAR8]
MDERLRACLATAGLTPEGEPAPLSGGDIAAVYRLATDRGEVVVKQDTAERLAGEAEGLAALAAAGSGLVVPDVLAQGDGWLVMEALEVAPHRRAPAALGEGLRRLHGAVGEAHGWHRDNACGRTPQPNAPLADGRAFQRERRLLPLAEACQARGLLDTRLRGRLEALAHGLEAWLPDAPASLVHGDLWSGNVLFTPRGPALIDPAVYRHYPEVDLAMLTLFGSPGEAFFEAYWDGAPPADWPRRETLFQLYPLLNHLLLFGGGYRGAVERAVSRLEVETR